MVEQANFAFLFEGQGQQYPGMFNYLIDADDSSRRIFENADKLCKIHRLKFRVSDICLEKDPEKSLLVGKNFNPCALQLAFLTGETATVAYMHTKGVPRANLNAGHSYGQWPAAVESGFLSFADVFKITIIRGRAMEQAGKAKESAVGLVYDIKRREESLAALILDRITSKRMQEEDDGKITVRNHPYQYIIGGSKAHIERIISSLNESHPHLIASIQENIQLSHHERLRGAQAKVSRALSSIVAFNETALVPLVSDVSNIILETYAQFKQAIGMHLDHDLVWDTNMLLMSQKGITQAVEIGPGKIFGGMIKLANIDIEVSPTNNMDVLDTVVAKYAHPQKVYSIS